MAEKWKGFKEVRVTKLVQEDSQVTSFYLAFDDHSIMPEFEPGQYVAIRKKMEDGTYCRPRLYTLSRDYQRDYYRVSIKREMDGEVSKILCDTVKEGDLVEITAPKGKFVLIENERPIVLIGGGIGITPMITMAYAKKNAKNDVTLIYSTPNSDSHSFQEEIQELGQANNIETIICYTRPFEMDKGMYDLSGRLTLDWMKDNLPADAEFYFCGPVPFMKAIYGYLTDMGIDKDCIHYELFNAGEDITTP